MSASITDMEVRWMIRKDLPAAVRLDSDLSPHPWDHDEWIAALKERSCIGMVAVRDGEVLAAMAYELRRGHVCLLKVVVNPDCSEATAALLERLREKISQTKRKYIECHVRETDLKLQLCLRDCWFKAVSVFRKHFSDTGEDAYVFQCVVAAE